MRPSAVSAFRSLVEPVFKRPEFVQAAALCMRKGKKGAEVLMITSLTTKRWIVPKGWPMEGRSMGQAAAQEAWEEAGVKGHLDEDALGSFTYRKIVKGGVPVSCRCWVYRIDVDKLCDDYPEKGRRLRAWMKPGEAAKAVTEPELREILKRLA